MDQLINLTASITDAIALLILIGTIALQILFAMGVRIDAKKRMQRKDRLLLVHPDAWAFLVLITGLIGVGFYWVMHESRFGKPNRELS